MPEIAAAVSKIMRLQDLVIVAAKIRVITRFRNTIGLPLAVSSPSSRSGGAAAPRAVVPITTAASPAACRTACSASTWT